MKPQPVDAARAHGSTRDPGKTAFWRRYGVLLDAAISPSSLKAVAELDDAVAESLLVEEL